MNFHKNNIVFIKNCNFLFVEGFDESMEWWYITILKVRQCQISATNFFCMIKTFSKIAEQRPSGFLAEIVLIRG